jgi:uncharacterized protein
MKSTLTPTLTQDRMIELDLIRGLAVLGILTINIIGFAGPVYALYNPAIFGGHEGLDRLVFYIQDALFDGRMRGLLCLTFGAGLAMMIERAERLNQDCTWALHRRYFWLTIFGVAHVLLLQMPGDILFDYGIVALLVWGFARASSRTLVIAAISLLALVTVLELLSGHSDQVEYQEMTALQAARDQGQTLEPNQAEALDDWFDSPAAPGLTIERKRAAGFVERVQQASTWTSTFRVFWDQMQDALSFAFTDYYRLSIAATFLLGIVLYRNGFLTGKCGTRSYLLVLSAAGLAALATHVMTRQWAQTGFADDEFFLDYLWRSTYEASRLLVALGWAALLILSLRWMGQTIVHRLLAAAGQMALTVYLTQTVIATTLFFGWGFALFGRLSRAEVVGVALVIQVCLAVLAFLWLKRFKRGPMEALWRRLQYRR